MNPAVAEAYRCPYTGENLRLEMEAGGLQGEVVQGSMLSVGGLRFAVRDGIPHLIQSDRETYSEEEKREKEYYEATSRSYDAVMDWLFKSFFEDESTVRNRMVDSLDLKPSYRVLETGAGTCRDTAYIARRIGPKGEIFVQDLSPNMLTIGREHLRRHGLMDGSHGRIEFFIGNAARLPFPDGFFDAAFHFGGLNLFTDKKRALAEMARVVRVGGKVVIGDEGVAPWHRQSEYGAILMNSNRLYGYTPPMECVPENVYEVCLRWLLGNAFYLIDFRVGQGTPKIDLDLPIQGKRGGTHRTRFHGVLEGVTLEAKKMAHAAAEASGLTVHEWLDRAVRGEAERSLKKSSG
jgi:ubiquinone/menaquinone biosynthesis C-methylase UbiE